MLSFVVGVNRSHLVFVSEAKTHWLRRIKSEFPRLEETVLSVRSFKMFAVFTLFPAVHGSDPLTIDFLDVQDVVQRKNLHKSRDNF